MWKNSKSRERIRGLASRGLDMERPQEVPESREGSREPICEMVLFSGHSDVPQWRTWRCVCQRNQITSSANQIRRKYVSR